MTEVAIPNIRSEVESSAGLPCWMSVRASSLLWVSMIHLTVSLFFPIQGHLSWTYLGLSVVASVLYGWILGVLMQSLPLRLPARIGVAWLAIYVIQFLNPVLEGYFFTTLFANAPEMLAGALIVGIALTAPVAIGAGLLFKPAAASSRGFQQAFLQSQNRIHGWSLLGRIVLASVIWAAIYLINGYIVSPWVLPYYTTESVGFQLDLPSAEHLVILQIIRGCLYTIALLPIILWSRLKRLHLSIGLAGLLYVAGALAIFVISDQYPVFLRVIHGIELAVDSLLGAFAFVFALQLRVKS